MPHSKRLQTQLGIWSERAVHERSHLDKEQTDGEPTDPGPVPAAHITSARPATDAPPTRTRVRVSPSPEQVAPPPGHWTLPASPVNCATGPSTDQPAVPIPTPGNPQPAIQPKRRGPSSSDELAVDRGGVPVPVRQEHPDRPGDLKTLRTVCARASRSIFGAGGVRQPPPHRPLRHPQTLDHKAHMAPCRTVLPSQCQQAAHGRRPQRDQRLFPQHSGLDGRRSCRCCVHMVGPAVHRRLRYQDSVAVMRRRRIVRCRGPAGCTPVPAAPSFTAPGPR